MSTAQNSAAFRPNGLLTSRSGLSRMTELAFARLRTIVRLGEAVPDIPIASAVDFILPVNCRRSTAARIGMSGTASPRRTIVLSLAKANSVILESPERDVKRPFRPKSSTVLGENGVLWVSSAVNFPVVCSCLRVALACTPKLERHHAERALRRSRDLLGQEPTSPSLRAPNDMDKTAPLRASDADQDVRPADAGSAHRRA